MKKFFVVLLAVLAIVCLVFIACPEPDPEIDNADNGLENGGENGNENGDENGDEPLTFDGEVTITATDDSYIIGNELTAHYDGTETEYTWQWQQGTTDIPGETNETFTPTEEGQYRAGIVNEDYESKWSSLVLISDPGLPSGPYSGIREGSGLGYEQKPVGITLTLVNGAITIVDFDLSTQSPAQVMFFPIQVRPSILANNAVEFDTISGVTETSNAVKAAGVEALSGLEKIGGLWSRP